MKKLTVVRKIFDIIKYSMIYVYIFIAIISNVCMYAADYLISNIINPDSALSILIGIIIAYIVLDYMQVILYFIEETMHSKISVTIENKINKYYFEKLINTKLLHLQNYHTGYISSLIEKLKNLTITVILNFSYVIFACIIGFFAIELALFSQSIVLGFLGIAFTLIIFILDTHLLNKSKKYQDKENKASAKYNSKIIDLISNIQTVKKLGIFKYTISLIDENEKELEKITYKNSVKQNIPDLIINTIAEIFLLIVLVYTALKDNKLNMIIFYITSFYSYLQVLRKSCTFNQKLIKLDTVYNNLDEIIQKQEDNSENKLIAGFEKIQIKDGKFKYDTSCEINIKEFTLKPKDKISIIGESGQGKSTFLNILSGYYDLNSGKYLVDGKEKEKDKILNSVIISQETQLLDTTIRENLTLGKEISNDKLNYFLERAGLKDFIYSLPDGLDTIVGEKEIKLSVGQKQRLNIIRALLLDRQIYIFDEPTSNLDRFSEEKIYELIFQELKDKSYIIVTHKEKMAQLCNIHYIIKDNILKKIE